MRIHAANTDVCFLMRFFKVHRARKAAVCSRHIFLRGSAAAFLAFKTFFYIFYIPLDS